MSGEPLNPPTPRSPWHCCLANTRSGWGGSAAGSGGLPRLRSGSPFLLHPSCALDLTFQVPSEQQGQEQHTVNPQEAPGGVHTFSRLCLGDPTPPLGPESPPALIAPWPVCEGRGWKQKPCLGAGPRVPTERTAGQ